MTEKDTSDALSRYEELVRRYAGALDLMSSGGLVDLPRLLDEAVTYGELIAELRPSGEVLDVGSGAGLPGIPVALRLPEAQLHLVEKRRRRVSFLRIAVSQLGLKNVTLYGDDVREIGEIRVPVVTAQAVGSFSDLYRLTAHLHEGQIWLLSRKGPEWSKEVQELERCLGSEAFEVRKRALGAHGTLVAVSLPGGLVCPPSG